MESTILSHHLHSFLTRVYKLHMTTNLHQHIINYVNRNRKTKRERCRKDICHNSWRGHPYQQTRHIIITRYAGFEIYRCEVPVDVECNKKILDIVAWVHDSSHLLLHLPFVTEERLGSRSRYSSGTPEIVRPHALPTHRK